MDQPLQRPVWYYEFLERMKYAFGLKSNHEALMGMHNFGVYLYFFYFLGLASYRNAILSAVIRITKQGITFPFSYLFSLKFRLHRQWEDIQHITVVEKAQEKNGSLILFFKSGGKAIVNLAKISFTEMEQLTLSIEMRAPGASKSPEFENLLDYCHNAKLADGKISFTEVWELDINRKFSHAAFVPFEPGQLLQGGKYKIIRPLSIGGLSAVYLAQVASGKRVIVKESVAPRDSNAENPWKG